MPWPPQAGTSRAYTLKVNGRDITDSVPIDEAPVRWEDEAGNDAGELSFVVDDTSSWAWRLPLLVGADVRLMKGTTTLFGGTLVAVVHRRGMISGRWSECTVASYEAWTDWRIAPRWSNREDIRGRNRFLASDRACVQDLFDQCCRMIDTPDTTVDLTSSAMGKIRLAKLSVREVLEEIADRAQTTASPDARRWYVDPTGRLHWYKGKEGGAAPYAIDSTGVAGINVEDLVVESDGIDQVHHVYVVGADAHGSGWVYNQGSDWALGAKQAFLEKAHVDSVNEKNRVGRAFLRRHAGISVAGSCRVVGYSGWKAGQTLTITDPAFGLSGATTEIRRVSGTLEAGNAETYELEFGTLRRSFIREVRRTKTGPPR